MPLLTLLVFVASLLATARNRAYRVPVLWIVLLLGAARVLGLHPPLTWLTPVEETFGPQQLVVFSGSGLHEGDVLRDLFGHWSVHQRWSVMIAAGLASIAAGALLAARRIGRMWATLLAVALLLHPVVRTALLGVGPGPWVWLCFAWLLAARRLHGWERPVALFAPLLGLAGTRPELLLPAIALLLPRGRWWLLLPVGVLTSWGLLHWARPLVSVWGIGWPAMWLRPSAAWWSAPIAYAATWGPFVALAMLALVVRDLRERRADGLAWFVLLGAWLTAAHGIHQDWFRDLAPHEMLRYGTYGVVPLALVAARTWAGRVVVLGLFIPPITGWLTPYQPKMGPVTWAVSPYTTLVDGAPQRSVREVARVLESGCAVVTRGPRWSSKEPIEVLIRPLEGRWASIVRPVESLTEWPVELDCLSFWWGPACSRPEIRPLCEEAGRPEQTERWSVGTFVHPAHIEPLPSSVEVGWVPLTSAL